VCKVARSGDTPWPSAQGQTFTDGAKSAQKWLADDM
jgi:hypothetical protein